MLSVSLPFSFFVIGFPSVSLTLTWLPGLDSVSAFRVPTPLASQCSYSSPVGLWFCMFNMGLLSPWTDHAVETWIPSLSMCLIVKTLVTISLLGICTSLIREFWNLCKASLWRLHRCPGAHVSASGVCIKVVEGSLSHDLENARQAESRKKQHVSAQLWGNSRKEHIPLLLAAKLVLNFMTTFIT